MAEIYLPIDWDGVTIPDIVMPGDTIIVTGTILASTQIAFEPEIEEDPFVLVVDTCTDLDSGFELQSDGMTTLAAGNGVFKISNMVRSGGAYFKVYPDTQPTWTVEGVLYSTPAQSAEDIRDAIGLTSANLASLIEAVRALAAQAEANTTAANIRAAIGLLVGANLDEQLADILAAAEAGGEGGGGGGVGDGDVLFTWTEYQTGHQGNPNYVVPDVTVVVYANATATGSPITSGVTDELGQVKFFLDEGTYYLFRRKAGKRFTNPTTIEVS